MKRILVILVLLIMLVPTTLLAQDELTLENLAETVKEMNADFGIFARGLAKVNSRVDDLEEQLASLEEKTTQNKVVESKGDPCVVISSVSSMMSFGSQLRPETLDAYINKFGSSPEDVVVKYARFHPQDGILEVRYKLMLDPFSSLEIVERWNGCEFLGVAFESS